MIKSSNLSASVVLLAHNIRSSYNVGSLFRTCEGLGVKKLILSGYSPYPRLRGDKRLPHEIESATKAISKTALGAEKQLPWDYVTEPKELINTYKTQGYIVVGLEQTINSVDITSYTFKDRVLLIVGNELTGIDSKILKLADDSVEIPMKGKKESFNVTQAAAMALFYIGLPH